MTLLGSLLYPIRLVALSLIIASVGFGLQSLRLGLWQLGIPGAGLMPLLASLALLPIAIYLLLAPIGPKERAMLEPVPLAVGGSLLAFVVAMSNFGFLLTACIFCFLWVALLYRRTWLHAVYTAVVLPLVMYAVFVFALGIPLIVWPE